MKPMGIAAALSVLCTAAHCQVAAPLLRPSATEAVRVTMHVGADRALVRETCSVYLPEGTSDVQFRWTEAPIDDASVSLHGPDDVAIGGLRRPAGESKVLSWPVQAPTAGMRRFIASYFVTGLKWSASYRVVFDAQAQTASLVGSLHLTNDSKLPLRNARLELAPAPTGVLDRLEDAEATEPAATYAALDDFTLEPGMQRRVTFLRARDVPIRILYRADPEAFRQEVRKFLMLDLRDLPVPGTLPRGGLQVQEVVGGRRLPVTAGELVHAADRDTEVALGVERDIVYDRRILSRRKTDVEFDRLGRVSGYDTSEEVRDAIRNRLPVPVRIELIEKIPGKWDFASRTTPTRKEANEVRWEFDLEPNEAREIVFKIIRHIGSRAD